MDEEARSLLLAEIDSHREAAVSLLGALIRIPSVTGDEGRIQRFLADYLETLGLEVDLWESSLDELRARPEFVPVPRGYEGRPNILARLRGTGDGRSLLLNGHTDTVPAGALEAWEYDPFEGALVDGRLYGRGAADMKSGVAAMTMAARCVLAAGLRPRGDLLLNFVVDEELSGHGTLDTILRGYTADAAISGETSGNAVQPACIGRMWFEIVVKGKPAGIQRRYLGVSAIDLGYEVVKAVSAFEELRVGTVSHPLYPKIIDAIPCMVGSFEAGSFPSAFPDQCRLTGSIATVPGEDQATVRRDFVEHVRTSADGNAWLREHPPDVRFVGYSADAAAVDPDHPIVRTVADSYREVTGREPEISGRQGAADTRFLAGLGEMPAVIFGPGDTTNMHASNEFVDVRDFHDAVKTIALSICAWCDVE